MAVTASSTASAPLAGTKRRTSDEDAHPCALLDGVASDPGEDSEPPSLAPRHQLGSQVTSRHAAPCPSLVSG